MTNQIFEISVRFFDENDDKVENRHRVYGKDIAVQYGMEFGACDNVEVVDVIDISTGEVVLTVAHGKVTWAVDD